MIKRQKKSFQFSKLFFAIAFLFLALGSWVGNKIKKNLAGVCSETGTILSYAEKYKKAEEEIKWNIDTQNRYIKDRNHEEKTIYFGYIVSDTLKKNNIKIENYSSTEVIIDLNYEHNNKSLDFYIHPSVPDFAKHKDGRAIDYYGGVAWYPVSDYYKITGYAFDYLYLQFSVILKYKNEQPLTNTFRIRTWSDACGRFVPVPEEYEVG